MHGNENSKHQTHIEEEWGRGQKPVPDCEENIGRSVITTIHVGMQSGSQSCSCRSMQVIILYRLGVYIQCGSHHGKLLQC